MKKLYIKTIHAICVTGLLTMGACNTFESEPLDRIEESDVVNPKDSTAVYMKGLHNAVYTSLPDLHTRLNNSYLDAATDDAVPTREFGGASSLENYRNGRLSSENISSLDGNAWSRFYTGIRRANLFLEKIEGYPYSKNLTETEVTHMKAEVHFLRAYFYFELVKRWGGVPLIGDKVINYDENWDIPRSNLKTCIDYILSEIKECKENLWDENTIPDSNFARITKGMADALVSRLMLYRASDLYADMLVDVKSDRKAAWTEAAAAAKRVMDEHDYDLLYTKEKAPDATTEPTPGFLALFGENTSYPNKEIIMLKASTGNTSLESANSPCGYQKNKCNGYTSPSQNLVDAFLMKDGRTIEEAKATGDYDDQNPYVNRDPRLTYTIFYNGSMWLKRPVETFNGGLDRSNVPGLFTTQTGYYLRKFLGLNEDKADNSGFNGAYHHYLIIRYAEILLNYAEALNEVALCGGAANVDDIEDCIMQLRKRAGIEAGTNGRYGLPAYNPETMRKIIRNERRIELAFEEHRFWDIRRWKIAMDVMNEPVMGVEIFKETDGTFKYDYRGIVRTSTFSDRMYWYPIARGEMQGNPNLTQNPGWNY